MDANASSTSPPKYHTEAWSESLEGLCFFNWKNEQRKMIDFIDGKIAKIEERLEEVESVKLTAELRELRRRLPMIKANIAKSPGETRELWNQERFACEFYVYVD